jgi:hypothetical protein
VLCTAAPRGYLAGNQRAAQPTPVTIAARAWVRHGASLEDPADREVAAASRSAACRVCSTVSRR